MNANQTVWTGHHIGGPRGILFAIFKLLAIAAAILVCGWIDGMAQQQRPPMQTSGADCLTGVVKIDAGSLRPAVVRLSLARGAVSIVEFPANDGVYYVHEGNPKFAAVFDSPTKATDRSLTVLPGAELRFDARAPAAVGATITMQMRSGLIVVLEYSAVGDVRQNSSRCVISYSVSAIAEARNAIGLSNLTAVKLPKTAEAARANAVQTPAMNQPKEDPRMAWAEDARKLIEGCFRQAAAADKCVANWTAPRNGLSIGASRPVEMADEKLMLIVGVRNSTGAPKRLAPGYPGLRIETRDQNGRTLESAAVRPEQVFFLFPNGEVPAGATAYFALVYKARPVGVRQRLTAIAAHQEAADDPVSVAVPR